MCLRFFIYKGRVYGTNTNEEDVIPACGTHNIWCDVEQCGWNRTDAAFIVAFKYCGSWHLNIQESWKAFRQKPFELPYTAILCGYNKLRKKVYEVHNVWICYKNDHDNNMQLLSHVFWSRHYLSVVSSLAYQSMKSYRYRVADRANHETILCVLSS